MLQDEVARRVASPPGSKEYGILSVLARLEAARKAGKDVTRESRLLDYFLAEARQARRVNCRVLSSRQESLHHKIFRDLSP